MSPVLSTAQLWYSQHKKDMDLFEWLQRKVTKMICGIEHFDYEEGLRQLHFVSQEKKRLQGDFTVVFLCP